MVHLFILLRVTAENCFPETLMCPTLGVRRGEQPQRGTSGGCSPSPARPCSAWSWRGTPALPTDPTTLILWQCRNHLLRLLFSSGPTDHGRGAFLVARMVDASG